MSANQKKQQARWDNYCKQMSVFSQRQSRYDQYLKEESRIRTLIAESVPNHIMPEFDDDEIQHPREVLLKLKQSMSPNPKVMKRKTEEEYDRFIKRRWRQWPYKGPDGWIDEWSKLMKKCQRWAPDRKEWATSFIEVWEDHHDLTNLIGWIQLLIREERLEFSTSIEALSNELRTIWERKKRQQTYPRSAAPRTTRAVFNTTFDGQGPEDQEDAQADEQQQEEAAQPQKSARKGHKRSNQSNHEQQQRKTSVPKCWFCDGYHKSRNCSLALQKPIGRQSHSERKKELYKQRIQADPELADLAQAYRTAEQQEADQGSK